MYPILVDELATASYNLLVHAVKNFLGFRVSLRKEREECVDMAMPRPSTHSAKSQSFPTRPDTGTHGMVLDNDTWHVDIACNIMNPTWQMEECKLMSSVGACHSNEYLLKGWGVHGSKSKETPFSSNIIGQEKNLDPRRLH